jgi:O-antigen/teichoic acid export membrane protein
MAPVVASTLLGIITIPLLVQTVGSSQWGTLAVVQSTSQIVGILVAFGWGATGPSTIAVAQKATRPQLYLESLVARCALFILGVAIAAIALSLLTRGDWTVALLGSFAYLLPFVGAAWYFIGEARPWRLFAFDSLPGLLGALGGLIAVLFVPNLLAFLFVLAAGHFVAVVLDAFVILRRSEATARGVLSPRAIGRSLAGQRHAVTTALTSGMYVNLPLIAVQAFVPAAVPVYALADRFFRYANIALSPVQQFFQGWVPESGTAASRIRMRFAAYAGGVFGLLAGILIATLTGPVALLLSGGHIRVPFSLSSALGTAFIFVSMSSIIGFSCLVPLGRVRSLAVSTVLGAVVGTPLIILFAALHLPVFVAWSVALSEAAVATYQALVLRQELSSQVWNAPADRHEANP